MSTTPLIPVLSLELQRGEDDRRAVLQLYTGTSNDETAVLRIGRDRRDRISDCPLEDEHVLLAAGDHDRLVAALHGIRPPTLYAAVIQWQDSGLDPTLFVGPDLPAVRRRLAHALATCDPLLHEDDGEFLRENPPPPDRSADDAFHAWLGLFRETLTVPWWTTYQLEGTTDAGPSEAEPTDDLS